MRRTETMRPIAGGIELMESGPEEFDSSRSSSSTMDLDLNDEEAGRATESSLESLLESRLTLLAEETLRAGANSDVLSFGVSRGD